MPGSIVQIIFAAHEFVLKTKDDISEWPSEMIQFQVRIMREWPSQPQLLDALYELTNAAPEAYLSVGRIPD